MKTAMISMLKDICSGFFMNLSEDLMKDSALRMKQIKELYQEGCQNPLLRLKAAVF